MRLILNVIWLVLCGWWMAILYVLAGIIAAILIITIPFAIASLPDRVVRDLAVRPVDRDAPRRRAWPR